MYPTHSRPRPCALSGLPQGAPSSSPHLSSLDYNLPRKEDFFLPIPTCPFGSRWYRSTRPSQTGQSDTRPSWAGWRFFVQWTEHRSCGFREVDPICPDECPGWGRASWGFQPWSKHRLIRKEKPVGWGGGASGAFSGCPAARATCPHPPADPPPTPPCG